MKGIVDGLVVTGDEIVDTPESESINPSKRISCRFIVVVLLSIVCLLMFVAAIIKCYEAWINNSINIIVLV